MSTYQYYEFQRIEGSFTDEEREEINSWSSRATADNNKVSFVYHYGDFRKDMEEVMWEYFDVGIYLANWGSRRLMIKLPLELVDYKQLELYVFEASSYMINELRVLKKGKNVLLDMNLNEEEGGGYWLEGEGWLSDLSLLRADILNGDYRSLFITWVELLRQNHENEELGEDYRILNSLIPPNLKRLPIRLTRLVDFFEVDLDWVNSGLKYSLEAVKNEINYEACLKELDSLTKDKYLGRLLAGESNLGLKLKQEIKSQLNIDDVDGSSSKGHILFQDYLKQVNKVICDREGAVEAEKARLHQEKMEVVKKDKTHIEGEIERHILKSNASGYKFAVSSLIDLRDLSEYEKKQELFKKYLSEVVERHRRKQTFVKRLREGGLID